MLRSTLILAAFLGALLIAGQVAAQGCPEGYVPCGSRTCCPA